MLPHALVNFGQISGWLRPNLFILAQSPGSSVRTLALLLAPSNECCSFNFKRVEVEVREGPHAHHVRL